MAEQNSVSRAVHQIRSTSWGEQYVSAWSPDGARIAIYTPGDRYGYAYVPPQLFTVAPDGTDRRDLIRVDDDGKLAPANAPKDNQW